MPVDLRAQVDWRVGKLKYTPAYTLGIRTDHLLSLQAACKAKKFCGEVITSDESAMQVLKLVEEPKFRLALRHKYQRGHAKPVYGDNEYDAMLATSIRTNPRFTYKSGGENIGARIAAANHILQKVCGVKEVELETLLDESPKGLLSGLRDSQFLGPDYRATAIFAWNTSNFFRFSTIELEGTRDPTDLLLRLGSRLEDVHRKEITVYLKGPYST
jgi:hypothetical protein